MAKKTSASSSTGQRLASLDILRGLDLFLLLFLQPVLVAAGRAAHSPAFNALLWHFDHEVWQGFRLWDLVMPLFLFMVGAAMPFSFARYRTASGSRRLIYMRIGRRFLLLFLFGMIVQGNLLSFDPSAMMIYNNTLQAIAVGYLIAAMILLHTGNIGRIIWTVLLLVIYWIPMAWRGDYTPEGNFAFDVDRLIIGRFRGDLTYTWIWSSLTFGATVMFGALAGELMKRDRRSHRTALILACTGVGLLLLGMLWNGSHPIIKRLWTASMTVYSAGWCFILMALFYWVVDCLHFSYGLNWLKIYGMNPITAYVIGEVINFRSIVDSVSYGLRPILGDWYGVWLTFGNFAILFGILLLLYRARLFLKV